MCFLHDVLRLCFDDLSFFLDLFSLSFVDNILLLSEAPLLFLLLFDHRLIFALLIILLVFQISLSLDGGEEMLLTSDKLGVSKYIFTTLQSALLVEVVHVQLPDEGCEVVVLEVLWQNFFTKLADTVDNEAIAIIKPSDVGLIFLIIEDFVELHKK